MCSGAFCVYCNSLPAMCVYKTMIWLVHLYKHSDPPHQVLLERGEISFGAVRLQTFFHVTRRRVSTLQHSFFFVTAAHHELVWLTWLLNLLSFECQCYTLSLSQSSNDNMIEHTCCSVLITQWTIKSTVHIIKARWSAGCAQYSASYRQQESPL